jgi:uncharacterized metal-binding protein YceD (DUF177 family)
LNETETLFKLTATEKERMSLSNRFGIPSIEVLIADVRIEPKSRGKKVKVLVHTDIFAKVIQTCVVTLDPIESEVRTGARVQFVSDVSLVSGDVEIWGEDDDSPDLIVDGVIDVGELVAEQMALLLDPFPRKVGVNFVTQEGNIKAFDSAEKKPHPFADLEKLKGKLDDNT